MATAAEPTRYPLQPKTGYVLDDNRGKWGMLLTICTEAMLFVCMFGAYYYLENNKDRWAIDEPPKLHYALIMLAVLLLSSVVLFWGEQQLKNANYARSRLALGVTILMGIGFLALSSFDYKLEWKTLTPYSDSYGSIFYAIVSLHAAHVIVGLLILMYVFVMPRWAPALRSPYRPYHVASLYWHFVDVVWVFVVGLLYVLPNIRVYGH